MHLTRTLVCSIVLSGALCAPALAALGGMANSVESDRASLRGSVQMRSVAGYTVHEITTASGGTVREYLNAQGKVFAVAWHGTKVPSLKLLLGDSFAHMQQVRASLPVNRDHRHLQFETSDLVVQSNQYLRSAMGRAWLPTELPGNFAVSAIN
jgi:hypothetical protein